MNFRISAWALTAAAVSGCGGRTVPAESAEVWVPAGPFIAGANCQLDRSEPGCDRSFYDRRQWRDLDAFSIDRHLVTHAEYQACVQSGACSEAVRGGSPLDPVQVRYPDALAYCRWKGALLPTNDQFERIARGTDGRVAPWGAAPSPCRDSEPTLVCLNYEGPAGARSVAFAPQWVFEGDGGLIRGASEFTFEALPAQDDAAFRCARPAGARGSPRD